MTPSQPERYERFLELHARPDGFVMPNAWDAVSALLLKEAGFEAIGTSSAALAASLGRVDGRHAVSRDEHLAHAVLLGDVTGAPTTMSRDAPPSTTPFGASPRSPRSAPTSSSRPSPPRWRTSSRSCGRWRPSP